MSVTQTPVSAQAGSCDPAVPSSRPVPGSHGSSPLGLWPCGTSLICPPGHPFSLCMCSPQAVPKLSCSGLRVSHANLDPGVAPRPGQGPLCITRQERWAPPTLWLFRFLKLCEKDRPLPCHTPSVLSGDRGPDNTPSWSGSRPLAPLRPEASVWARPPPRLSARCSCAGLSSAVRLPGSSPSSP